MKKANPKTADDLRPEYKRFDFGPLVRGKYASRIAAETNIVVHEKGRDVLKARAHEAS